jgi:Golgi phosphoprotein 3 (GPP34)
MPVGDGPRGQGEAVPGLNGTGLVADDLYLLAHHELSGKPYVQSRALGLGLAGGLLAELMLLGNLGLRQGAVVAAERRAPKEALAHHVLSTLANEREPHPLREWLLFLARRAAGDVAHRLERSGYLTRTGGRWRGWRLAPVDADSAFAPLLRVRAALDATRPLSAPCGALAGLATACGLGFRWVEFTAPKVSRSLEEAVVQLGPELHELIAQTQAAVDSALLSHRV